MADRHPQYPMMPNFNPSMLQQQMQQQSQSQQQQQQQQQDNHQAMQQPFNEHNNNPLWSQMHQLQNQFRPNNGGGGDMNNPQMSQQMANLLQSQAIVARQSNQQNFQLGMQPMGGPTPSGSQQPPFHNPSGQQNPLLNNNFGAMNGGPASGMQPSLSQNSMQARSAMMQAFNQTHNRQLNLIDMAGNQQNQHAPLSFPNRLGPTPAHPGGQNNATDIFSPPMGANQAMRQPSPAQPPGMAPKPHSLPQPLLPNGQPRPNIPPELQTKMMQIRAQIAATENSARQLHNSRAGMSDAVFMQQAKHYNAELTRGKEMLNRLVHYAHQYHLQSQAQQQQAQQQAQQQQQQQQQNQHQNNVSQGMSTGGPSQTPAGNTPPTWMQQQHASSSQGPPFNQGTPQQMNTQPSPSQRPLQPNPPNVSMPNRPAPTPQQAGAVQSNPFMQGGSQLGSSTAPNPALYSNGPPPPLEKERFEKAFENYSKSRNLTRDARSLVVEGRPIDLHTLHSLVIHEGGYANVSQRDYWSVIAGRLGFVQFPGNDVEPPKSGPATALAIDQIYKEFLAGFDQAYINSIIDGRRKLAAQTAAANQLNQPNPVNLPRISNAQQMQLIMAYADQSAAQLRANGVQEHIILFIEQNRENLLRTARDRNIFRDSVVRPGGQPEGMAGMVPNRPFSAASPHQNANSMPHQNPVNPQQFGPGAMSNPGADSANMNHSGPTPQQKTIAMNNFVRSNQQQLTSISQMLNGIKQEFLQNRMHNLPPVPIAPEQRLEYNNVVEQLHRSAMDLDAKLPMLFFFIKNEARIRKIAIIIVTVQQQRNFLSSSNPRFIVSLDNLRHMLTEVQKAHDGFNAAMQSVTTAGVNMMNGMAARAGLQPGVPPNAQQQMAFSPGRPANAVTPAPTAPSPPGPPAMTPGSLKKKPSMQLAAASPTPPPQSAPTPTANAPTPSTNAASSPKSPKSKAKPKPPPKRRQSKVPATEPAPVPRPASTSGVKRQREEDIPPAPSTLSSTPPFVADEPSPPKRFKNDWEGPSNEALKKREEQAANVSTDEQAAEYFQQMTELIKMATNGEGQESLSSDISDAFDVILKNYSEGADAPFTGASLGLGEAGSSTGARPPSPPLPSVEEYDFFDFSSFETEAADEDDGGSKAATPDLVPSSSTNPSPDSGSEADGVHHAPTFSDLKMEEPADPLRLSTMKEVDGGESTYYQSTEWKWDGPMTTLDQPWAIFTS